MKILIVDDSKAMRMIVIRTMRQAGFGGHTVAEAANGREALDAIAKDKPDLVLTDWAMPEMNGIELLKAIKEQNIAVKTGVVTSQGGATLTQEARQEGALFVLTKPFTPDSFRAALEPVLG